MIKYIIAFSVLLSPIAHCDAQTIKEEVSDIPVIIIMADQLRYDAIGTYTPHINELKKDGASFSRTYTASPLCAPSRAAFFTGRYPNSTGALINGWTGEDARYAKVKSGTPNLYQVMSKSWETWQNLCVFYLNSPIKHPEIFQALKLFPSGLPKGIAILNVCIPGERSFNGI